MTIKTPPPLLEQNPPTSTKLPLLFVREHKLLVILLSIFAFFYLNFFVAVLASYDTYFYPTLLLSGCFIGIVELFAWQTKQTHYRLSFKESSKLETITLLIGIMLVSGALSIALPSTEHVESAIANNFLVLHILMVMYIVSRSNALALNKFSVLLVKDIVLGFVQFPLKHFFSSFRYLGASSANTVHNTPEHQQKKMIRLKHIIKTVLFGIATLYIVAFLIQFVSTQLASISPAFNQLWENIAQSITQWIQMISTFELPMGQYIGQYIIGLPIAMWLFGLIHGSFKHERTVDDYTQLQNSLRHVRIFPKFTAYIIVGALCIVYSIFFIVAFSELQRYTAPKVFEASHLAVEGFNQLMNVAGINFVVLCGFYLFLKDAIWHDKTLRILIAIIFSFATVFALLSAWQLFGLYLFPFGATVRRLLAGWAILVLLLSCILTVVRSIKLIPIIRIIGIYAILSYGIISLCMILFVKS